MEDEDVGAVEFVARQNAKLSVDFEEHYRRHQGAGKLEGVGLGEGKNVRHLRAPPSSKGDPRLMASLKVLNWPRSPRRRSQRGRSLLAGPSRVDRGRPGEGAGTPSIENGRALLRNWATPSRARPAAR
jgi:hypothetical protein